MTYFQSSSFLILLSSCLCWQLPYFEILSFLGLHSFLYSFTHSANISSVLLCAEGTLLGSGDAEVYHILVERQAINKYGNEHKVSCWIMMRPWWWPAFHWWPLISLPLPLTVSLVLLSGSSVWCFHVYLSSLLFLYDPLGERIHPKALMVISLLITSPSMFPSLDISSEIWSHLYWTLALGGGHLINLSI